MCEIRYMTKSHTHPDAEKDKLKWKAGQIITIEEDGHPWTFAELNGENSDILKMPGVARDKLRQVYYQKYENASDLLSSDVEVRSNPRQEGRRRYVLDTTKVTEALKNSMESELTSVAQKEAALDAIKVDASK